ncbi:FAD:protein FMN transferase [Porticoccaceae bacterium]|jgi:thiamine biosynthesis lipoprotein|nr:FAD:protein FMN transferase [Porticoccaceae bacterium]MDC1476546.1 FAD:protein FMN transferase [Porticoccaceae bacterium]|tara:strand:+ start:4047 stop:5108 length:1062 start_codon:yes stop_codon:yes gene_type:complete
MTSVDNLTMIDSLTGPLKRASFLLSAVAIASLLALTGCDSKPEIIKISGTKMGTTYHVTVVADQPAPDDLAERIDAALSEIDQSMSTYKADSEITRFNDLAVDQLLAISPEFSDVLTLSQTIWQQTDGAFDPTVGPLVDLWGFGAVPTEDVVPSDSQIADAMTSIGLQYLHQDGQMISKLKPIRLDLSAVAKGYGVDQVANLLEMLALPDYLVEVGGEMRVSGTNPKGQPWKVAVELPALMPQVQRVIAAHNAGIATSGDYRNYFEQDGVRYSHTIDPRTGRPITHGLASVTVVAETCAEADGWATALMVLGEEQGMLLADQQGLAVYMLVKEGDDFKAVNSEAFAPYLVEKP